MPTRHRDAGPAHTIPLGSGRPWLGLSVALFVLGGLELLVGALLIRAVADPPVSTVLEWGLGLATAALLIAVASPVFAKVQAGAGELLISFGLLGGLRAPLTAIDTVDTFRPDPLHPVELGIAAGPGTPVAAFSRGAGAGFVRIRFSEAQPVRHQILRRTTADGVMLRVDAAEDAVAMIRDAAQPRDVSSHG